MPNTFHFGHKEAGVVQPSIGERSICTNSISKEARGVNAYFLLFPLSRLFSYVTFM